MTPSLIAHLFSSPPLSVFPIFRPSIFSNFNRHPYLVPDIGQNTTRTDTDAIPSNIYLFKCNNRNTRKKCEKCSKLTIKTPEECLHCSGALIVNAEHISSLFLELLNLNRQISCLNIFFSAYNFIINKITRSLIMTK